MDHTPSTFWAVERIRIDTAILHFSSKREGTGDGGSEALDSVRGEDYGAYGSTVFLRVGGRERYGGGTLIVEVGVGVRVGVGVGVGRVA